MMRSRRSMKPATMTVGLSLSCKPLTKRQMPETVKTKAARLFPVSLGGGRLAAGVEGAKPPLLNEKRQP